MPIKAFTVMDLIGVRHKSVINRVLNRSEIIVNIHADITKLSPNVLRTTRNPNNKKGTNKNGMARRILGRISRFVSSAIASLIPTSQTGLLSSPTRIKPKVTRIKPAAFTWVPRLCVRALAPSYR